MITVSLERLDSSVVSHKPFWSTQEFREGGAVAPALCAESSGSALPQPSGTCALRASKMDDHRAGSIAASLSNRSATVKSGEVVYACLRQPVLGATGFIGSAIVQELSHAGMTRSDAGAKSLIDACADASSDLEATPSWRGRLAALSLRKSRGHGRRAAALSAGTSPALSLLIHLEARGRRSQDLGGGADCT